MFAIIILMKEVEVSIVILFWAISRRMGIVRGVPRTGFIPISSIFMRRV